MSTPITDGPTTNGSQRDGTSWVLGHFLVEAYGNPVIESWKAAEAELAAADEQTSVFGDSGVNASTKRFLLEVNAMLDADAGVLRGRHGEQFNAARDAARILLEFADFNSNGEGATINHSRDWYMANRILRSLEGVAMAKAVYWAHNSHVAHPKGSTNSAGGLLRVFWDAGTQHLHSRSPRVHL